VAKVFLEISCVLEEMVVALAKDRMFNEASASCGRVQ